MFVLTILEKIKDTRLKFFKEGQHQETKVKLTNAHLNN